MLVAEGGDPAAIVEREGLGADLRRGELEAIVDAAIEANPEAAEQIRAGNEKAIGAIVGAVMKETKGRADGGEVNELIREARASDSAVRHFVTVVTKCILERMAWNVVIAGGGFAGATAARELERLMPKQSARLMLVNDVNFLLYTPFLPEAAAGTLEPRHVVTPLRDILDRTYLRLGAIDGHDPAARTVELREPRRRDRGAALRPAAARARLGLAGAAGARPRPSTRSASRASPTRSGCATT